MDLLIPFFIGIGLSMDCLAVSLVIGSTTKKNQLKAALLYGVCFGLFQAGMTIIGGIMGLPLTAYLTGFGYWVAFFLLVIVGAKMIIEGLEVHEYEKPDDTFQFIPVLILSLATSIDALAIGISFAFLHTEILIPSLIIGIIAFFMSFAGVMAGHHLSPYFGNRIDLAGGVILILIGVIVVIRSL